MATDWRANLLPGGGDDGGSTQPFVAPGESAAVTPFAPGLSGEPLELSEDDVQQDDGEIGGETLMLGAANHASSARPALPFAARPATVAPPQWAPPAVPREAPGRAPAPSSWAGNDGWARPAKVESPPPAPVLGFGGAAPQGVVEASNAAARVAQAEVPRGEVVSAPARVVPVQRASPREALRFLFEDSAVIERVHRHERWKVLLAELELRLLREGADDAETRNDTKARARRDIFEVLSTGEATPVDRLREVVGGAVDERGRFEPPLVLLSGELDLPFEGISTLKATVAAVRPIAGGDKRLVEVLDAVEELARTPWLEGSSGVSEGLLARVREAFLGARRAVGWDQVESHTERMLLERRCYQQRSLWGKTWLRGLMRGGPGGEVPVYLPEGLRGELPLFKRIRVKLLGELEAREDQYEASAVAVKVVALARVFPGIV
jgi:hypothetical protein